MDSAQPPASTSRRKHPKWTYALLFVPYVALCFPGLYARATPALLGFPFFYWYQLAWVVLTSILLFVVYRQFKTPE